MSTVASGADREDVSRILVAGGPRVGKTTFAREFLPNEAGCPVFVNADLIAAGISPFAPESVSVQAGRLMLKELARHFAARENFAFETTLSGRGYLKLIDDWRSAKSMLCQYRSHSEMPHIRQSGGVNSSTTASSGAQRQGAMPYA